MIINDEAGWILTSPSKCGTESIMSMVKKANVPYMYYQMPKHARVVPDEFRDYTRYMVVRNPYDRMWSAYQWLRRRKWWRHDEIVQMNFGQYCRMIYRLRDQHFDMLEDPTVHGGMSDWLFSCSDIAMAWEPTRVWRLEDEFDRMVRQLALGVEIKHTNADKSGVQPSWSRMADAYTNGAWAIEDCEQFGYELVNG